MEKKILLVACTLGFLAIIFGAFGAHALKKTLTIEQLNSFETGVKYQMYHALFLLLLGVIDKVSIKTKKLVFVLVIIGLLFFSGSIYGLSTNELSSFDFKAIGFITPIGGLLLISSWLILGISILIKEQ
jgi:uncharacterized membrane protein YgdD (TMEM256/DUF423 family)